MRAKQRMCPSAHPDLCLAAIPPGGRSGGWDDPAMKHANPCAGLVGPLTPAELEDLSGTVLEGCKKPLAAWVPFIRLALLSVPPGACTEACRISHRTAWERRHRLFAAVGGCQDRIVLRGRVWADEACVSGTDLSKGCGQARRRGLSKQKLCMAVGIDARKEPVAVACGHGRPSAACIRAALGGRVAEGATPVHDRERAHDVLVRESGLADEPCKADARDPEHLEAMELASSLCPWLRRCL